MVAHAIGRGRRILSYGVDLVTHRHAADDRLMAFRKALASAPPEAIMERVSAERQRLLDCSDTIEMVDFGAGSHRMSARRSVADMARISGASSRKGRMLAQAVAFLQPDTMLELGTSLGLSACYQQLAHPIGRLVTIEGSEAVADQAARTFESVGLHQITLLRGRFEEQLDHAIDRLGQRIDYAYFDGNHAEEPTLDYFERCLPFAREGSVFVFDDIYWSDGMLRAWRQINRHPRVTATIDAYDMGFAVLGGMEGRLTMY